MKCPQCGHELRPNSKFCAVCGLDLEYVQKNDPALYRKMVEAANPVTFNVPQPTYPPRPAPAPAPAPVPVRRKGGALPVVVALLCVAVLVGAVVGVVVTTMNNESGSSSGGVSNSGSSTQPYEGNTLSATNITGIDYTVDGEDYSMEISYSEYGQPVHGSIVYRGHSYNYFKMSWDEDGYLTSEYYYELDGNDTVSEYYQYTYNDTGKVVRIDYYDGADKGHNIFVYDENGKQIGVMMYDEAGKLTETQTFAYSGENKISEYYVNGTGDYWTLYEHKYDSEAYLYETVITDSDGYYERVEYTMLDSDTEQKYRYSADGNILGYTVWEYDGNQNLISEREYDQDYTEISVHELSYDGSGHVTREYSAAGGNTFEKVFQYDPLGNLMSMVYEKSFADGTSSHAEYEYIFEAMTIPEELADPLRAGMEIAEINQDFVNIIG